MSEFEPQLEPASVPTISLHLPLHQQTLFKVACVFLLAILSFFLCYLATTGKPHFLFISMILDIHLIFVPGVYHFLINKPLTRKHMIGYTLFLVLSLGFVALSFIPIALSSNTRTLQGWILGIGVYASGLHLPLVPICLIAAWSAFKFKRTSLTTFFMALPMITFGYILVAFFAFW